VAGSVNRVILVGRLGKDPELSYLPSGQSVAKFSLATNRYSKDKSGEKKEETDWHNIVAWGKTGEICAQYLTKGRQAYIEGRIQNRTWDDKEGKKHYATDIVAENVVLLGSRGEGGAEGQARPAGVARPAQRPADDDFGGGSPEITDDDIPF
jgi:single-strand DNA-binding protein